MRQNQKFKLSQTADFVTEKKSKSVNHTTLLH